MTINGDCSWRISVLTELIIVPDDDDNNDDDVDDDYVDDDDDDHDDDDEALHPLEQEKMTGQRGKLKALAGICHVHEVIFRRAEVSFSGGSLFSETSACSLASLSGSQ